MRHLAGYDFTATLPAGSLHSGDFRFTLKVASAGTVLVFPHDSPVAATRAEFYSAAVVPPDSSVILFDPARDIPFLSLSRSGEARNHVANAVDGSQPGTLAYPFGSPSEILADDFTASLYIGDRIADRGAKTASAKSLRIRLKGVIAPSVIRVTLVEKDGSAWSEKVFASAGWKDVVIPIGSLAAAKSAMVPQAFPGTWSYWLSPPAGRTSIDLAQVERLQFSLRSSDFGTISSVGASQAAVAIESVSLDY
jgi:hypothetical protein